MVVVWSFFKFLGIEGYKEVVKVCMDGWDIVIEVLKDILELDLLGSFDISFLCFVFNLVVVNVFELVEWMKEKGWFI